MSFYNSIPPSEKPGLYPAGTFPTANYAPSQPAGMPPAATPQQRYQSATQQYAMPAGAASPSLYTPSNGYIMSPAYASSPAPGAFHSVGYSSLPSIPSTTPGYPTAQYPTTNYATQLPGGGSPYSGGLPVTSQLYAGGAGYSPLQSVQPRAYTMPPIAYPSTLGTNPTYPGASPFGPPY